MVPLPSDGQSYGAMHSSPRPVRYLEEGLCLTTTCDYSLNAALSHCSIIWQEHYLKNTLVLPIYIYIIYTQKLAIQLVHVCTGASWSK